MYFLAYVSSAVKPFSDQELLELLETSRRNNSRKEITGLLLYADGNFMQVLEGPKMQVLETHGRILVDPWHRGVITLVQGDREQREFTEWSMGFRHLKTEEPAAIPGYSDFLDKPLNDPSYVEHPASGLRLLSLFRQTLRRS